MAHADEQERPADAGPTLSEQLGADGGRALTRVQAKELWRWAVHNRAFDLAHMLSEMRGTFTALAGETAFAFDSYAVAERQLRVCELELENLKRAIGRIDYTGA